MDSPTQSSKGETKPKKELLFAFCLPKANLSTMKDRISAKYERSKWSGSPTLPSSLSNDKLLNLAKQHIKEAPRLAERRDKAMARVKRSPRNTLGSPVHDKRFSFSETDSEHPMTRPSSPPGRLGRALAKANARSMSPHNVGKTLQKSPPLPSSNKDTSTIRTDSTVVESREPKPSKMPRTKEARQGAPSNEEVPASSTRKRQHIAEETFSSNHNAHTAATHPGKEESAGIDSQPAGVKGASPAPSPKLSFAEKQAQFGRVTRSRSPIPTIPERARSFSPKPTIPSFRSLSPPPPKKQGETSKPRNSPVANHSSPTPTYSYRFGAADKKEQKPAVYTVPSSGYMSPTKSSKAKVSDNVLIVEEKDEANEKGAYNSVIETPEKVSVSSMKAMFGHGKNASPPPRFRSPIQIPSLKPTGSGEESVKTLPVNASIATVPSNDESTKTEPVVRRSVQSPNADRQNNATYSHSKGYKGTEEKSSPAKECLPSKSFRDKAIQDPVASPAIRSSVDLSPSKRQKVVEGLPKDTCDKPTSSNETNEKSEFEETTHSSKTKGNSTTIQPKLKKSEIALNGTRDKSEPITTGLETNGSNKRVPPTWKASIETPEKISVTSMASRFGSRSFTPTRRETRTVDYSSPYGLSPPTRFRMEPARTAESPRRSRQSWIKYDDTLSSSRSTKQDDVPQVPKLERPTWKSKVAAAVSEETSKVKEIHKPVREIPAKEASLGKRASDQIQSLTLPKPINPDELTKLLNKRLYFEKEAPIPAAHSNDQAIEATLSQKLDNNNSHSAVLTKSAKEKETIQTLTTETNVSMLNETPKSETSKRAEFMERISPKLETKGLDPPSVSISSTVLDLPEIPKSPRQKTTKPWNKDLNTLSPMSWQRRSSSPFDPSPRKSTRSDRLEISIKERSPEIATTDISSNDHGKKHQLPVSPDALGGLNPPSFDHSPTKFSDVFFETRNPFRATKDECQEPKDLPKFGEEKSLPNGTKMSGAAAVLQFWTNSNSSSEDETEDMNDWNEKDPDLNSSILSEISQKPGIQAKQLVLSPNSKGDSNDSTKASAIDPFSPQIGNLLDQAVYADSKTFDSVWKDVDSSLDFSPEPMSTSGFETTFVSKGFGFSPKTSKGKKSSGKMMLLQDSGTWSFEKDSGFEHLSGENDLQEI